MNLHPPAATRSPRSGILLRTSRLLAILVLSEGIASDRAMAQLAGAPVLRPLVVTGDPAPDGDGTFSSLGVPTVNDLGHIAFPSSIGGSFRISGAFVARGRGIETAARTGDALPDGDGVLFAIDPLLPLAINEDSEVAFVANTSESPPERDGFLGIAGPETPLRIVARKGLPAPDGNGVFRSFDSVAIEDDGEAVFYARFENTEAGRSDTTGLYRGFGSETEVPAVPDEIARSGSGFDSPSNRFASISSQIGTATNGRIAFRAFLENDSSSSLHLFRNLGGVTSLVVSSGDPSPDRTDDLFDLGVPFIGRDGRVAADLVFDGDQQINAGVGTFDPPFFAEVLVREGDVVPGGGVFVATFEDEISYASEAGRPDRLAFRGLVSTGPRGLFLVRGDDLLEVARQGDPAPGLASPSSADGELFDFFSPFVTASGRVLFFGDVTAENALGDGVFEWSPTTRLRPVVRVGQSLLGSTVSTVGWLDDRDTRRGGVAPANDRGDLALRIRLADGRQAILTTNLPEPSRALALGSCLLALRSLGRGRYSR